MNKKVLIITISSVLALALVIIGVILLLQSSFFENDPTDSSSFSEYIDTKNTVISVESVSGEKGETVTVPVKIKGNPGFMAMLLEFKYDTKALKYKGYQKGDFLTDYEFSDIDGTLRFLTFENSDVNKNGVLVNIEFEILDTDASKADITLNLTKNSISNSKKQLIISKAKNGSVKIK